MLQGRWLTIALIVTIAILVVGVRPCQADIITNGDFETDSISPWTWTPSP